MLVLPTCVYVNEKRYVNIVVRRMPKKEKQKSTCFILVLSVAIEPK